jgi:hypothetical protein
VCELFENEEGIFDDRRLLAGLERLFRAIGRYLHDFRYAQEKKCVEEYVIKTRKDLYTQILSIYPHNVPHCEF